MYSIHPVVSKEEDAGPDEKQRVVDNDTPKESFLNHIHCHGTLSWHCALGWNGREKCAALGLFARLKGHAPLVPQLFSGIAEE